MTKTDSRGEPTGGSPDEAGRRRRRRVADEPETARPRARSATRAGEMANETEVEEGRRRARTCRRAGRPWPTTALAERTADLQRLQAEYLNYKRRVDRDRELVARTRRTPRSRRSSTSSTPSTGRASTASSTAASRPSPTSSSGSWPALGLVKFGAPGDAFDPTIHEALSHIGEDPDVEVTTCKVIAKAGYRIGDRVVRAAQVLVVDPASSRRAASRPAAEHRRGSRQARPAKEREEEEGA